MDRFAVSPARSTSGPYPSPMSAPERPAWSFSRAALWRECRRAYWFHYYGAWEGLEKDPTEEALEIRRLKRLVNRWMWAGRVVHDALAAHFTSVQPTPPHQVGDLVRRRMRQMYRRSLRAARERSPYGFCLQEHAYQERVPPEEWRELVEKAVAAVEAFHGAPDLTLLRETPRERLLSVEDIVRFRLPDCGEVYVVIDLAVEREGRVVVVDWKTGRPRPEDRRQAMLYAACARLRWGMEVEALLCHLPDVELLEVTWEEEEFEELRREIAAELAAMDAAHGDGSAPPPREEFAPSPGPGCAACRFRAVCPERGDGAGSDP